MRVCVLFRTMVATADKTKTHGRTRSITQNAWLLFLVVAVFSHLDIFMEYRKTKKNASREKERRETTEATHTQRWQWQKRSRSSKNRTRKQENQSKKKVQSVFKEYTHTHHARTNKTPHRAQWARAREEHLRHAHSKRRQYEQSLHTHHRQTAIWLFALYFICWALVVCWFLSFIFFVLFEFRSSRCLFSLHHRCNLCR